MTQCGTQIVAISTSDGTITYDETIPIDNLTMWQNSSGGSVLAVSAIGTIVGSGVIAASGEYFDDEVVLIEFDVV